MQQTKTGQKKVTRGTRVSQVYDNVAIALPLN